MQCAICNRDNAAGTKFCIHCGAALRAASPDDTDARPALPPAPAATPDAPVLRPEPSEPTVIAKAARPPSGGILSPIAREATPTIAKPQGQGVAIGLIVLLFALAGWSGYQALSAVKGDAQLTVTDLSKDVMALRELAKEAQSSLPSDAPGQSGTPPPGGMVVASEKARAEAEAAAKVAAEELAAKAEAARFETEANAKAAEAAAKATMKSAPAAKPAPPPTPRAPPKAAPPPAPPKMQASPAAAEPAMKIAVAPAAPPAPPPDPLVQLREELARCEARDLFSRLGCVNRARTRHCDPYWGKVPECPATWMPADKMQQ